MRLPAIGRLEQKEIDSKNRFHGKQIAKLKVKMHELLLKRSHFFFLHFFTNYCESQRMHMIIFCGSQAEILAPKNWIRYEIFIEHPSAAGELLTGPHQSLPEMSDVPMAIGEQCRLEFTSLPASSDFFIC